jgi:L,D-peptidoglycan transpeptidase YkuD (ErfK/YbiS/YcfS/YnhG family)
MEQRRSRMRRPMYAVPMIEVLADEHDRARGIVRWGDRHAPCALGPSGIKREKREGDGVTPAGLFPLRRVLYRADRIEKPKTALPVAMIEPDDGWCDAPRDLSYNMQVKLPFDASYENLWRDDPLYDLLVVVGHNDDPVLAYGGSAIFLHIARDDFSPTHGCVAMRREDLQALVDVIGRATLLKISD